MATPSAEPTTHACSPPLLITRRLRLRGWRPEQDAEVVRTLWSERDPRALHRIDAAGHPTVDELRVRLAERLAGSARTGLALLAVERRQQNDLIGYCGLLPGPLGVEEPEIAYELLRRVHGHGYATEAASAVVAAATEMGLQRLWATVQAWNAPSLRVLAKLEFLPSGRVDRDGERGDLIWLTRVLSSRAVNGVEEDHERQHSR